MTGKEIEENVISMVVPSSHWPLGPTARARNMDSHRREQSSTISVALGHCYSNIRHITASLKSSEETAAMQWALDQTRKRR
eukprot:GDKH01028686.1.p1 GENE.GDKH01028686.1~~GDKH01028686.1.p1  ORF type:complete len:81 (-),score=2.85 GDKH01028686.1:94-336(-)